MNKYFKEPILYPTKQEGFIAVDYIDWVAIEPVLPQPDATSSSPSSLLLEQRGNSDCNNHNTTTDDACNTDSSTITDDKNSSSNIATNHSSSALRYSQEKEQLLQSHRLFHMFLK